MMPTEITIRQATLEDLPGLLALEQYSSDTPWNEEQMREELEVPFARIWVACKEEGLVGFAAAHFLQDSAHLNELNVHPEERRQGIARQLLQALLQQAKEEGITHFSLEVRTGNFPARALYENLGFQLAGLRKQFYRSPADDAMILVKEMETDNL